ncbi:hypothetical protein EV363DRAFT_1583761 [Boletus edulis]|nr:hypothetical protein EV363DRAFT_1583761 [Boletus edulis]
MPPLVTPLAHSKFNLNSAGVAGFFGGKEAISAMATVHLYKGRRWLGWYNSPGSYTIAKRFGRMANSRFWDGLFPGPNDSPAVSFGLDGKKGPQYIAALSGTTLPTRHLGYLTMERSKEVQEKVISGRKTSPFNVAYLAMNHVDYKAPVKREPLISALWGLIPIIVCVVACVMCALAYDWFSFSMILLGIVSNGLANVAIGKGRLTIESVDEPASGAPPGHGIMMGEDEVIVIKGKERDVNAVTKGRFVLETRSKDGHLSVKKGDVSKYHAIGFSSLLLLVQFLLQLLLVPQGTLFGQIMFLVSLGVSWGYNSYLSSLEKEKIQIYILWQKLGNPDILRFQAGTRTTMATFVCLLLFHGVQRSSSEKDHDLRIKILNSCVPNDTAAWGRWKEKVIMQHLNIDDAAAGMLPYLAENREDQELPQSDRELLRVLLNDAGEAFREYINCRGRLPTDSSHQVR